MGERNCIDAARRYTDGQATEVQLDAANAAANAAEQAWQIERLWGYLSDEIVLPVIAGREP